MEQNIPTVEEFKQNIEELFGQKLTIPASQAAEDFWINWASFDTLIANKLLSIRVDTLFLSHNFPQYKSYDDAKKFAEQLMVEATINQNGGGYAKLCSYYIAGIIQLVSPDSSAHWPQYPSNIITGKQSFIST